MKSVVHLVTQAGGIGGAPRAAYRLHESMRSLGWRSTMLSLWQDVEDPDVQIVAPAPVIERSRTIEAKLARPARVGLGDAWSTGLYSVIPVDRHPAVQAADAIMMYWVGQGFLSSGHIGALMRMKKPIVWRLSDMWAFTGGCHYSHGCLGYQRQCGNCPQLRNASRLDVSRIGWWRKRIAWNRRHLTVICPSRWMANCAKDSSLLSKADVRVISTGIDTNVFRPIDRRLARAQLDLPLDRPLILFVAADGLAAKRKGGHLVPDILTHLKGLTHGREPAVLLLGAETAPDLPLEAIAMGIVQDEARMALVYAAADVFVAPYLEDNLPNTVLEAMSCGAPVVTFDIGGTADAIRPGVNGIAVPVGDSFALAKAVDRLLVADEERVSFGLRAREIACSDFNLRTQASVYDRLLQELIEQR